MSQAQIQREALTSRARRWRSAMADAALGPLIIAPEVVSLSHDWDEYRSEAEGLSCTAWLRKSFGPGRGLSYFSRRANAVDVLGESIRRTVHHDVAVWLVTVIADDSARQRAKLALIRECKKQNGQPLTRGQAQRVLRALSLLDPAQASVCKRCEKLEAKLKELGVEV